MAGKKDNLSGEGVKIQQKKSGSKGSSSGSNSTGGKSTGGKSTRSQKASKPKRVTQVALEAVPSEIKNDIRSQLQADLANAHKRVEAKKARKAEKEAAKREGVKLKPKSKARKRPVKEMQKEFLHLQKEAMSRLRELRENKMLGYSRAYLNALESKPKTSNTRRAMFHVEDRMSYKAIRREVARIREFLNDETSTVEGTKWAMSELELHSKYGGAFGKRWAIENNGHTFDPSRISEEYARTAYKIFRYLEEMKGSYNLMYGEGSYDSESLIISIYDMVVQRDIKLDDDGMPTVSNAVAFYDTVLEAREKLEQFMNEHSEEAKFDRELGNTDTGLLNWAQDNIVVDLLESSSSSREFLKKLKNTGL